MPWIRKSSAPLAQVNPEMSVAPSATETSAAMKALSAPATIQEARGQGATAGTILQAPLAPANGPITVVPDVVPATTEKFADGTKITTPAQEPMVVVAVKRLWDSPTIKAARNIIGGAILAVLGVLFATFMGVWTNGHSIFEAHAVNWRATEVAAEIAAGTIIATAFFAYMKRRDNNPVQK